MSFFSVGFRTLFYKEILRFWKVATQTIEDSAVIAHDHSDGVGTTLLVRAALARLSPCHREVLFECYYRGRTTAEAAAYLGIPVGTAKSRLYYGMQHLREILQAQDAGAARDAVRRPALRTTA